MRVIVYTKPHCPQCAATRRRLDRDGIHYESVDAIAHRDELINKGFKQTPIVMTPNGDWSGFRPDRIDALAEDLGIAW